MVNVNDFHGLCDNEVLENAIAAKGADGIVLIPPRQSDVEPERDYWLLDRAILLPANTTVVLQNATIKLSDNCRDNFFRTANCGIGIEFPEPISNVHIRGEGRCVLQGADHPRATGDETKQLHAPCPHYKQDVCRVAEYIPAERRETGEITFADVHEHSYGTDANREGESPYGDWRGIGILFANTDHFSISNITIREPHGWSISLEACCYGRVEKIEFDARMHKEIDGLVMNMENQDGVDLRNGCHHIVVSDITGCTGDDVVALTAIAEPEYRPGGSLRNTHVMHNDWTRREKDIHDIVIRNVVAHSYLCHTVRLLPAMANIYNVVIDGVIDTSPRCYATSSTVLLGDGGTYGENHPDSMRNITVSNVVCNSQHAVWVRGFLTDSVITNVVNRNPGCDAVGVTHENGLNNVTISNVVTKAN